MNVAAKDVDWLSGAIHRLYAAGTPAEFSGAVLAAMNRRFELIICACEELGHSGSSYAIHGMTVSAPLPANHIAFIHDHPILPRVNALRPIEHVRGAVSRAALERTDYFNGIARPMGYKDHVILRAQGAPTAVTVSLCRDRIFSPVECELLQMLQTHLTAAWRRVTTPGHLLENGPGQSLELSPALRPVNLSPQQFARLRAYFPGWHDAGRLPASLHDWVSATRIELKKGVAAQPLRVLAIEAAQGVLFFRYFPTAEDGAAVLRIMEKLTGPAAWPGTTGLSPREREVLHWIAQGKRDEEIGIILGLARKTVGKHVEHVLAKLGASNRTAAVALGRMR